MEFLLGLDNGVNERNSIQPIHTSDWHPRSHQVVQRSVSSDTRNFLSNAGAFHVAVEICGTEWSYGYAETGLGIFYHEPRKCPNHSFVKAIYLGDCKKKAQELWLWWVGCACRCCGCGRGRGGGCCFCCCCCCCLEWRCDSFSWCMNVDETVTYIHAFQYLRFTTIHVQFSGNGWNSFSELPVAIPNALKFERHCIRIWAHSCMVVAFFGGDMYHLGEYEIWMASEGQGQFWGQRVWSWLLRLGTSFRLMNHVTWFDADIFHVLGFYPWWTLSPFRVTKLFEMHIMRTFDHWFFIQNSLPNLWLVGDVGLDDLALCLAEAYDIFSKSSGSAGRGGVW